MGLFANISNLEPVETFNDISNANVTADFKNLLKTVSISVF